MQFVEAIDYFKDLSGNTDNRSEIKIYNTYIELLSALIDRDLTVEQIQAIEDKLDILDLKVEVKNKQKYLRRQLKKFQNYLKEEFSFIPEGYYVALSISMGISFGAAFGVLFDEAIGITYGVSIGLILGVIIGKIFDSMAERKNRVLKIKKR